MESCILFRQNRYGKYTIIKSTKSTRTISDLQSFTTDLIASRALVTF